MVILDIKGANILVDTTGKVKLADFGCSKKFTSDSTTGNYKSLVGTPWWMAPEVVKQSGGRSTSPQRIAGCELIPHIIYWVAQSGRYMVIRLHDYRNGYVQATMVRMHESGKRELANEELYFLGAFVPLHPPLTFRIFRWPLCSRYLIVTSYQTSPNIFRRLAEMCSSNVLSGTVLDNM